MANPFSDPSSRLDANPFDDPTIQGATNSAHSLSYLEEDDDKVDTPRVGQPAARTDDTAARLEEIRRREQELADRERNIGAREEHVRNYGKNNWPFFYPLIFHDIYAEIPHESRLVVLTLYRIWLLLLLVLLINMVSCIFLLVSGQPDGAKDMGAAIMYVPVIGVLSFLLWYRPIYNAFMKEHALFYYLFFVFGGFHIAFSIYMFVLSLPKHSLTARLVGIPSTGSAGLINTIHAFATGSILTGVLGVITSVGWGLQSAGALFEYRAIWRHHNLKGHSLEQAKNEQAQSLSNRNKLITSGFQVTDSAHISQEVLKYSVYVHPWRLVDK